MDDVDDFLLTVFLEGIKAEDNSMQQAAILPQMAKTHAALRSTSAAPRGAAALQRALEWSPSPAALNPMSMALETAEKSETAEETAAAALEAGRQAYLVLSTNVYFSQDEAQGMAESIARATARLLAPVTVPGASASGEQEQGGQDPQETRMGTSLGLGEAVEVDGWMLDGVFDPKFRKGLRYMEEEKRLKALLDSVRIICLTFFPTLSLFCIKMIA
jgi:hypothetical protein